MERVTVSSLNDGLPEVLPPWLGAETGFEAPMSNDVIDCAPGTTLGLGLVAKSGLPVGASVVETMQVSHVSEKVRVNVSTMKFCNQASRIIHKSLRLTQGTLETELHLL